MTTIELRHRWQIVPAVRRWRRLAVEFRAAGYRMESHAAVNWRAGSVTFVTLAADEESLRRAAATPAHVSVVRWAIPRRRALWSGVFVLSGWSSMSGPPGGVWSTKAAVREALRRGGASGQPS
jgi:hypothetical protein